MKYSPVIVNGQNQSIIEDTYLLAALMTFDPSISFNLVWNDCGKVVFEVEGPISEGMRRYYSGEPAPLAKYTSTLKFLRSSIFAMKKSCVGIRKESKREFERSVA
jgi:hypothetical protein